ncbi:MAG TPA: catalase family peroxidase [Bryobacteraceae bacterium]|nr:catalase family peroxidase [Bryobacteraceae bacterium]
MPLPTDETLLKVSEDLIRQFDAIFGQHPGFRPAHAKGALLTGLFKPSAEAGSLTRAPHMNRHQTPVTVRVSNSTGLPLIPDNDPNANPRGIAVRFHLAERVHTDVIGHSTDCFPTRTGEEFLEFLRAFASSDPSTPSPTPIQKFLGSHPAALAFVQSPKPFPSSFATESYFGVTAMRFTNKDGASRFGRYRIVPEAGRQYLEDASVPSKGPNYLFDELAERIGRGTIRFQLFAQLANPEDTVDDATIHWPEDRTLMQLGVLELSGLVPDSAEEQRHIIFDPIPRVDGIDASADPLLELRAAVYLLSGRRRRAAGGSAVA